MTKIRSASRHGHQRGRRTDQADTPDVDTRAAEKGGLRGKKDRRTNENMSLRKKERVVEQRLSGPGKENTALTASVLKTGVLKGWDPSCLWF